MDPVLIALISSIAAVVVAVVTVLKFYDGLGRRKSDATQVSITQGDINDSNVVAGSSGGPTVAAGQVDAEGGIAARDIINTTNIYQSANPPTTSALHQLPPPPADFTGRTNELARLEEQVQQGGAAISGVRGMGGVGKTVLALELARRLTPKFPDAQFYLDLKGTTQPLLPADAMAHVIRSYNPEARLPESEAELQGIYHSVLQGQRALLLMDNALDADQVEPLIPPQGCVMLVTSRQRFDLPGLYPLDLDTLTPEDARGLLIRIAPRIGDQADPIAERCGYLPLALRLAAGALNQGVNLTVEDYLRRLEDAQTLLDLVDASLTLSYDLLTPDLQESWAALSVFPESFDLQAAAAVWELEPDPAQDRLGYLINYSLVEYNQEAQRYRLHDLARIFGESRLKGGQRDPAQLRHARHFCNVLAFTNELYLEGGERLMVGLALFDQEWPNIRVGQAWSQAHANEGGPAAELCSTYPGVGAYPLNLRLRPQDSLPWLESGLAAARQMGDRATEATHLGNLGVAYRLLGEPRRAILHAQQLLDIAREIGDRNGEGSALGNLGNAHGDLREFRRAIVYFEQQLVITREIGDLRGEGNSLGNLGIAFRRLGEPCEAIKHHEKQLVITRETGDRRTEGNAMWNIALAFNDLDVLPQAISYAKGGLQIFEQIEAPNAAMVRKALEQWRHEVDGNAS